MEVFQSKIGQEDIVGRLLSSVGDGLGALPDGYGENRIVMLPRNPHLSYVY